MKSPSESESYRIRGVLTEHPEVTKKEPFFFLLRYLQVLESGGIGDILVDRPFIDQKGG